MQEWGPEVISSIAACKGIAELDEIYERACEKQTDVEYSLERRDKAVGVRCVTQHIVQPDEQIEVREQRFHG